MEFIISYSYNRKILDRNVTICSFLVIGLSLNILLNSSWGLIMGRRLFMKMWMFRLGRWEGWRVGGIKGYLWWKAISLLKFIMSILYYIRIVKLLMIGQLRLVNSYCNCYGVNLLGILLLFVCLCLITNLIRMFLCFKLVSYHLNLTE